MKNLLILFLIIPTISFAQLRAGDFYVTDEGWVNWQKVYKDESVSFEDLINTIKGNRVFSDIQVFDDKITFLGDGIKTNPSALGFSRMSTSFYALGDIRAYFTLDYKPGRYRITAVNIASKSPIIHLGNPMYTQDPETWQYLPVEESVGNGKGLKKGFIRKESVIMGKAIEKEFQIMKQTTDDDW